MGGQTYLYVSSVKKLPDFQTAGRVLSDKLLNVFCFEFSPTFKGVFLLKRRRHFFFFFFHSTFFYEHVNICIVIVYITV